MTRWTYDEANPQRRAKADTKAEVERIVANGGTVADALRQVNRDRKTYEFWRWEDKEWARRITALRAGNGDPNFAGIDFVRFRKTYFDDGKGRGDTPAHHAVMIEAIEKAKALSVTLVLAPPFAGKSSLMVDYFCWLLGERPNTRICVISENQYHAQKMMRQVQRRMTDKAFFPAYIARYGPFKEQSPDRTRNEGYEHDYARPWNNEFFTVLRATHDEKEPSFETKGVNSQVYGARYDLIVMDDVCSRKNMSSSAKIVEDLQQELLSRLDDEKGGKVIIVGTRVGPGDFYEKAQEAEGLVDEVVKIPALDSNGDSYWPERWPLERLHQVQTKVSASIWDRVYMQRSVSRIGASFPEEVLKPALDRDLTARRTDLGVATVCSLDPAHAGPAAFGAFAYDSEHLWLIDMEVLEAPGNNETLIDGVSRLSARYRPGTWAIEQDHGTGKPLFADVRLAAVATRFGFSLHPHRTGGAKSDPIVGVTQMAAALREGEIRLPYANDEARAIVDPLLDELRRWRPDLHPKLCVQDRVIALWIAWRWWLNEREALTDDDEVLRVPSWLRTPVPV